MEKSRRGGFTLIELLVFSAIFALIIGSFITILITIVTTQSQQSASSEAQQQGQFLLQQFQYYIETARLVDIPKDTATSKLVLRESVSSSSYDPTIFTLANGAVYLQQGPGGGLQPLTSNKVTISNLSFTRHYNLNSTSSAFGTDSVSYSFIVNSSAGNQASYSETFQSSASVLVPVPRIALIQQAKAENNTGSPVTTLTKAFTTNNEIGNLLLAVVVNQTIATSSITDINKNNWVQIASTTYPAYSEMLTVYAAKNVVSGADIVTASFGSGVTYPSMYLYEYRGTTLPLFDTWGAQLQASTTNPTSPFVSPTSTVELLLGIDNNAYPTNAIVTPGAGYTLETSSTINNSTQVFVEDRNQYITNPVAAGWTSNILTSSTAMIITFIRENNTKLNVSDLVVAGGGGGGGYYGGGGGGGGIIYNASHQIVSGIGYSITVGGGGVGGNSAGTIVAGNGGNSTFDSDLAIGGGGGGNANGGATGAQSGASGGGGGQYFPGALGIYGQGYAGGSGNSPGYGGGGGAGEVGENGSSTAGNGGNGLSYSISGSATYYGGGGGGGGTNGGGNGGLGGGGIGVGNNGTANGTANTGGGGGGNTGAGGNGGSGIVIISAPTSEGITATGGTLTIVGGNDIWTFTSSGTWTPTF